MSKAWERADMGHPEVVVVGAGPGGSSAAIHLARLGVETLVLDKARFPRDKTCGDGLTTMALRELRRLGLPADGGPRWNTIRDARFHSPSERQVVLPLPRENGRYAAVAARRELDAELVSLVREAGATVEQGLAVTGLRPSDSGVAAHLEGGRIVRARYAVLAVGSRSRLLANGEGPNRRVLYATRLYLDGVGAAPTRVEVFFYRDLLPGYAWIFPLGEGAANAGVVWHPRQGAPKGAVRATSALLERPTFRSAAGERASAVDRIRTWPIATEPRLSALADRILPVGDAAGLTDPMTGEGIGQALTSGRLAAEAIASELRHAGPAAGAVYRRVVDRSMRADRRTSVVLSRMLSRSVATRGAVRLMGVSPCVAAFFGRWTFEEIPRSAVRSPRVLRLARHAPQGLEEL